MYVPANKRLGDTIIGVNNAIHLAKKLGKKLKFSLKPTLNVRDQHVLMGKKWASKWAGISNLAAHTQSGYNSLELRKQRLEAALYLFRHEEYLEVCDHTRITEWIDLPKYPVGSFLDNSRNTVGETCYDFCYDFVGTGRRFSPKESTRLIGFSSRLRTVDCHRLGLDIGLIPAINEMSKCLNFVGSCSGMAHVAYALGLRVHMILVNVSKESIEEWHRHQKYVLYDDVDDFIKRYEGETSSSLHHFQ